MHINLISTSSLLLILLFHHYLLLHHYCTSHLRQMSRQMTIKQIEWHTVWEEATGNQCNIKRDLWNWSKHRFHKLKSLTEWKCLKNENCSGAAQHATQEEPDKTPPSDRQAGCSPQSWCTSCFYCPATRQQSRLSQSSKHTGIPIHNCISFVSIYATGKWVW